ncbi:hypothetical protein MNEG_14848 [Monoraphidium neglectum]|uniref:PA domain-containing protein n=1 Tax=Monoraphidium neglectum TaxID=145388 RepID=A0A0D2LMV0_9CHLO|nr:hypothetical protein MNEG_14848 [Monoraphidium neglectum]KIY93114.1 hypothetical protein MNEG_14848 [Monoraphidium neglectum]|eukprot:XP_013892134.1 hypothetical protein MNEG_14848 [Monoraphidium neglectum]
MRMDAVRASFGPQPPRVDGRCMRDLVKVVERAWTQPAACAPRGTWWGAAAPAEAGRCPSAARCELLLGHDASPGGDGSSKPDGSGNGGGSGSGSKGSGSSDKVKLLALSGAPGGLGGGTGGAGPGQEQGRQQGDSASVQQCSQQQQQQQQQQEQQRQGGQRQEEQQRQEELQRQEEQLRQQQQTEQPHDQQEDKEEQQQQPPQQSQQQQQQQLLQGPTALGALQQLQQQVLAALGKQERRLQQHLQALQAQQLLQREVGRQWLASDPLAAADALACAGYDPCGPGPGSWLPEAALNSADARRHPCGRLRRLPALRLAAPDPPDGCSAPRGSGGGGATAVKGSFAVVLRGGCSFVQKALAMQAAGAVGLIVVNVFEDGGMVAMSDDGTGRRVDIPALLIGGEDGKALLWWLERRPLLAAMPPQQQQQQQQQQQPPAKGAPGGGGRAAGASGGGGGEAGGGPLREDTLLRVDLLLPATTQGWLLERLGLQQTGAAKQGKAAAKRAANAAAAVNDLLHQLMRDGAALGALESIAGVKHRIREGGKGGGGRRGGGGGKEGSSGVKGAGSKARGNGCGTAAAAATAAAKAGATPAAAHTQAPIASETPAAGTSTPHPGP